MMPSTSSWVIFDSSMSKFNIALIAGIVLVLGIGGFLFYKGFRAGTLPGMTPTEQKTQQLVPVTTGKTATAGRERAYHQEIDIDARSFFFSPDVFLVKKGEMVTIRVHAYGNHAFAIDEFQVNKKTPDGEVTTIQFTPQKEGAYRFHCPIPGHAEAGMTGVIMVE